MDMSSWDITLSYCRKPVRTSTHEPLLDTGDTMIVAGALENFYGNYKVRGKKVKSGAQKKCFHLIFQPNLMTLKGKRENKSLWYVNTCKLP